MEIFPAIDIKNGKCVRLKQGDFSQETVFSDDPVEQAKKFQSDGFANLHIVDLDAARTAGTDKELSNLKVIEEIAQELKDISVQVGGGVRSVAQAGTVLSQKAVDRVIVGTICITDPDLVLEIIKEFPDRVIIGLDTRNGSISTHGWTKNSEIVIFDLLEKYEDQPIHSVICTDISRDGMMEGPNFDLLAQVNQRSHCKIIASGGISSVEDVEKLEEMGIYGAVLGQSLYSGSVNTVKLREILKGSSEEMN